VVFIFLAFPAAAETQRAQTITADQAAARILEEKDKVRVVFIYRSTCPACVMMFDDFVAWITPYKDKVAVLAFSTDVTAADLDNYLGDREMPFERLQIEPWEPGGMDAAMKPAGIEIGQSFGTPLLAVINAENKIVGQYEGVQGLQEAKWWLRSTGVTGPGEAPLSTKSFHRF
jgi:hypothetical protein